MALAKPIVSFDLTESIYSASDAAIYVENNDERQFAESINTLIKDPTLRLQMGQAGFERIETELAWKYSARKLLDVYSALYPETSAIQP